jgi:ACT domain-containing protein
MPRRFLTAEDVRRAVGNELVVDETTVVTPQALETAQAAGIRIRTARGDYREPVPDRGPDAARAQVTLPHLPEPASDFSGAGGFIVTAVGKNRPGVLAELTQTLLRWDAGVRDISQKMVEDYFHLVLMVELSDPGSFGALKQALECLGGQDDYVVRVMHERVFRFMHRI